MKLRPLYCGLCGKLRIRPLFFAVDGDDHWPICHDHVDSIAQRPGLSVVAGGWEYPLSGSTYITKVRR